MLTRAWPHPLGSDERCCCVRAFARACVGFRCAHSSSSAFGFWPCYEQFRYVTELQVFWYTCIGIESAPSYKECLY